jgi:hypothetical protein
VKYFDCDNVREDELGGASCTNGDRRRTYSILVESLKERDQLKDLSVNGHIILECILKWDGKA